MLLQIEKLHPLFGAEVGNVDLSKPIDQAGIDAIQAALDKYAVLIFHGPKLTEETQISFAERFGPLEGQNVRGGDKVFHWSGGDLRPRRSKIQPVVRRTFVLWTKGSRRDVCRGSLRGGSAICFQ